MEGQEPAVAPVAATHQALPWLDGPDKPMRLWRLPEDIERLVELYASKSPVTLRSVLKAASAAGSRTVVDENRYVDADWRSEHAAFWSRKFAPPPALCRRLHFLAGELDEAQVLRLETGSRSLGYSVIRPLPEACVGRTVLAPPVKLLDEPEVALCWVEDPVSLFGTELTVAGVPYASQDGQYIRCAHTAAWIAHYAASRRGLVGRQLTSALAEHGASRAGEQRLLPSPGLAPIQIQQLFTQSGMPAQSLWLRALPTLQSAPAPTPVTDEAGVELHAGRWDTRLLSVLRRYLDSGLPVIVGTPTHAFCIVGWHAGGPHGTVLIAADDRGPFEVIEDPFNDNLQKEAARRPRHAPWHYVMIGLPAQVLVTGEEAEEEAYRFFVALRRGAGAGPLAAIAATATAGEGALRSMLMRSNDYKAALESQGRAQRTSDLIRTSALPQWVWVVEVADASGVVAELVIDSTSSPHAPHILISNVGGVLSEEPPHGPGRPAESSKRTPWRSHQDVRREELLRRTRRAGAALSSD